MIKTIADVCEKVYSGGTPSRKRREYFEQGTIPWLNTGEIAFNRIYKTENYITEAGLNNSSAKWVPANTVIVAMYGATAARTSITKIPLTTNQACCNLVIDEKVADYRYVYYYICSQYTKLASLANGGAQQNLNAGQIKDYPIVLPDLPTQTKIADILSTIDDRIENNTRINDNLSEMLQSIYQQKFCYSDDGEGCGVLADICDYSKDRISVSALSVSNYYSTENMLPGKAGAVDASNLPTIAHTTKCKKGDVLISNIRPYFKKIIYCQSDCGCSTDVLCFTPKSSKLSAYLFSTLYADRFFDFMVAGSKGTKMPRGDKQQIMTYTVHVPSDTELNEFNKLAKPMLAQIESNRLENISLSAIRDGLLPKLMSGEIDVSEINL